METRQVQFSLHELIQEFVLLKQAFTKDGHQLGNLTIGGHDCVLSEIFEQILDYAPVHKSEAIALVDFLLNSLSLLSLGPTMSDQVNAKILEVVASDYQP